MKKEYCLGGYNRHQLDEYSLIALLEQEGQAAFLKALGNQVRLLAFNITYNLFCMYPGVFYK